MMSRFLLSIIIGLIVGTAVGLYLGWGVFPVEYLNSPASNLAPEYKEQYTIMVAAGYQADRDPIGAVNRLRVLGVDNVPSYVQEMTERFITNSRNVEQIRYMVALSEGLGRLTPIMEPYRIIEAAP